LQTTTREYVWRRKGEELNADKLDERRKHTAKINVWGCFSFDGIGPLVRIDGTLTAEKYKKIVKRNVHQTLEWVRDSCSNRTMIPSIPKVNSASQKLKKLFLSTVG
jgi:hypothetical protein